MIENINTTRDNMSERPAEPEKDVAWVEAQLSAGALQDHFEAAVNKACLLYTSPSPRDRG